MSPTTFLFAPCNEFVLLQRAFETALPALFLGNNVGDYLLYSPWQMETSTSLERFLLGSEAYEVMHQQKLPLSSPLQLGTLYWRPLETESDDLKSSPKPASLQISGTEEGMPSSDPALCY